MVQKQLISGVLCVMLDLWLKELMIGIDLQKKFQKLCKLSSLSTQWLSCVLLGGFNQETIFCLLCTLLILLFKEDFCSDVSCTRWKKKRNLKHQFEFKILKISIFMSFYFFIKCLRHIIYHSKCYSKERKF